ncbi:hypothetical protein ACHAXR_010663 [Thalassiosira sp. AJA248-18]
METIKRIGQPAEKGKTCDEENEALKPMAPSLFGLPSKNNLHPSTGFVHCCVTRVSSNRYHLSFQADDAETVSIIANKIKSSRTSNYHMFDCLRGGMNAKLSKKAGHYIGKLRRDKDQPVGCYTLYNSSREKEQVAAYVYDIPALMQQVTEGQPPRKMQAVVPKHATLSDEKGGKSSRDTIKAGNDGPPHGNRLMEHLHNGTWKHHKLVAVQTRPPKYHEGQYRLNFQGRVLCPSVKNTQLENEQGDCLLQFGKVDEKTFHLDYKAPFSAFSAFGAALCQFDL